MPAIFSRFPPDPEENPIHFLLAFALQGKPISMSDMSSNEEGATSLTSLMFAAMSAAATVAIDQELDEEAAAIAAAAGRARKPPALEQRIDYLAKAWMRLLRDKREELPDPCSRAARRFRLDFRLPYPVFLQLVQAAQQHRWLYTADHDAARRPAIPIELELLAVLYLLSSGCALRTVASLSGISEPSVQRAVHDFCTVFAADMYDE